MTVWGWMKRTRRLTVTVLACPNRIGSARPTCSWAIWKELYSAITSILPSSNLQQWRHSVILNFFRLECTHLLCMVWLLPMCQGRQPPPQLAMLSSTRPSSAGNSISTPSSQTCNVSMQHVVGECGLCGEVGKGRVAHSSANSLTWRLHQRKSACQSRPSNEYASQNSSFSNQRFSTLQINTTHVNSSKTWQRYRNRNFVWHKSWQVVF